MSRLVESLARKKMKKRNLNEEFARKPRRASSGGSGYTGSGYTAIPSGGSSSEFGGEIIPD